MRPFYSFSFLAQLLLIVVRVCGWPMKWYIMFAPAIIMIIVAFLKYRRPNAKPVNREVHFRGKPIKQEWTRWYDLENHKN